MSNALHASVRALLAGIASYYPDKFPQETGAPSWPAIRGTIVSRDNALDQCGAGELSEEDVRLQIDVAATKYSDASALTSAVSTALAAADPPWIRQPGGFERWDSEAKVEVFTRDWVLYQSST